MKRWEKVYKKNKDMVSREIDNEMILMPIFRTSKAINEMYTLNKTATRMWELIDCKRTLKDIAAELRTKYKAPEKTIGEDLEEFIKDMKEIKAIK